MKSKAPMTACILASIVALGSTGYGFASGTLFKTRQAVQADSIPDNLTTEKSEGSAPLYVEGASGQQYAVTDADGNPVYIKSEAAAGDKAQAKGSKSKSGKGDIKKSDLYIRYTVKRGDTLTHLSNEFGSSVDTLVRLNNINNPDLIYTDEVLHIPSNPPVIVSEDGEVSEP